MTVDPEVIDRLIKLKRELAELGRGEDAEAVGSAVASLTQPPTVGSPLDRQPQGLVLPDKQSRTGLVEGPSEG